MGNSLFATYIHCTARKGTSSVRLGKMLGVNQETAWFALHRLRESMQDEDTLSVMIEVDESYVGGSDRNRQGNKWFQTSLQGENPVFHYCSHGC